MYWRLSGMHVPMKQPSEHWTDYINRKGPYTLNIQAVANHRYCFTNVLIKLPGSVHDARIFSNSSLNQQFRDGAIPIFEKVIVQDQPPLSICLLGDPAYPLLPFLMKEFTNGGKNQAEAFFRFRFSSARMVILNNVRLKDLKLVSIVSGEKWTLT